MQRWNRFGKTALALTARMLGFGAPLTRFRRFVPAAFPSHSRGMGSPIRDGANDNQPRRPSVGDSLRATAARADIGPRLAQMLRDAAALSDVLDRKIGASEAAQAEFVHSVQELIDALELSISRLNRPVGQPRR